MSDELRMSVHQMICCVGMLYVCIMCLYLGRLMELGMVFFAALSLNMSYFFLFCLLLLYSCRLLIPRFHHSQSLHLYNTNNQVAHSRIGRTPRIEREKKSHGRIPALLVRQEAWRFFFVVIATKGRKVCEFAGE